MRRWQRAVLLIGLVLIAGFLSSPKANSKQQGGMRGIRYSNGGAYIGSSPSMSPDGSKIVFGSPRDGLGDIYIVEADGTNWRRLTFTPEHEGEPKFSPDGSQIVFVSERDGPAHIYIMDADGSNQIALTDTKEADAAPSFSPDGSRIVFGRRRKIFVMNSDGSHQRQLTTGIWDGGPSFSPDGKKIVFQTTIYDSVNSTAKVQMCIVGADGSEPDCVQPVNKKEIWNPSFSPDGQKVTFISYSDRPYEGEIYTMDVDGSNVKLLTRTGGFKQNPQFTPDGSHIMFLEVGPGGRQGEIKIINADGSQLQTVVKVY